MFKSSLIKQRGRGSLKRGLSSKKKPKGNSSIPIITIIEAEFIINLLVREICSRGWLVGLIEANIYIYKIFSPAKTKEQFDEVGYLVDCILRGDKREYEEELKFQDLHNIALGIRWTLENCNVPLVPYQNYKDFVSNEQDWQYDPKKGSFNQFIASLFKSNQQILLSIFDLFSQLIIISPSNHNNKMFVTMKLIKSVSMCIMKDEVNNNNNNAGDTNNNDVLLGSSSPPLSPFETAYKKWLKTSNNLLHLFLAYLREISVSQNETNLDPKLSFLLDNYVENRKKCLLNPNTEYYSLVDTSNKQDLGSILVKKSSKEVLPDNHQVNTGLSNLLSSIAGPSTFNALKRRTSLMVGEKSIEQKWSDLQNEGIDLLSEPALKLFFVFDERDESPTLSSNSSLNFHLKRKNFNNNSNPNIRHSNFKQSFLWEEFKNIGFKDPDDNVLSIGSTLGTSISESLSDNNNNYLSYSSSFSIANNGNNNDKRDLKFLCIRIKRNKRNRRSKNNSDSKEFQEAVEGEDDYLVIEAIDEISPFVWIENLQNQIEKMSEWVILETKVGIEFNEPDWILLNDKQKFLTELEERSTNRHKLNQGEKIGNNDGNVGSIRMSILNGLNLPWTKLLLTNRLSKFNSSNQNLTNDNGNNNNKKLLPDKNVEKDTVYPQHRTHSPPLHHKYGYSKLPQRNYDNIEEVGDAEAGASVGVGIGTTSTATPATTTKNTKIVTEGENESSGIVEISNEDDESPIDYEYQPSATEAPKSAATDSPSLPPSSSASSIAIDNYYYQYEDDNDLQYNAISSSSSTSTTAKKIRQQNYQQPPYGYYYPSPPTLPPPHLASSVRNSIRSSNSSKSGSIGSGGYVAQSRMVRPQLLPRPKNHQTFYKGYDQTYMPTNNPTPMSAKMFINPI
ncbi:19377_t:CDS:2 [Entrophospora sp. SA101]|nr:19377_t:CDS:2 [Entrophospora sp. SA101]